MNVIFTFYDVKVMAGGMGKFKLAGESERGVCNMITCLCP
jgi:hypothetical protein